MSSIIQRALSGGELDPVLWARSDVTKYMSGLRTLRNAFVRRNGGVQARPGSTIVTNAIGSQAAVRLIPFIFSQSVSYVIEINMSTAKLRFYKGGSLYTITNAPAYNNATTYHTGDVVTSGGVTYLAIYNSGHGVTDTRLSGDGLPSFVGHTPPNATYWYALTSGIYEIPFQNNLAIEAFNIRYDQSGNDLTMTHQSWSQVRLSRFTNANGNDAFILWGVDIGDHMDTASPTNNQGDSNTIAVAAAATVYAVSAVSTTNDERAERVNSDGTTLETIASGSVTTTATVPSGGTPITINWSAVPNAVAYNIYYMNKKTGVFGFIGQTNLLTFVDAGITPDYSNPWVQHESTLANRGLGTTNNDPLACAYYQQRMFYANTVNSPTKVWGSQTGLYDNMDIHVPSLATDALSFQMTGHQDAVQHLLSLGSLLVFTYGTINSINGDSAGAISPSSINPHRESIHGCASIRPLIVGEFCLYVQAQGSVVRDLGFNFQVDGYRGDDLTTFASHLFDKYSLVEWAYQSVPHSMVWVVRSDGSLLSMTYVREQQIMAWAHHDTADGFYECVAAIPEENQVFVYAVVNRPNLATGARNVFVERFAAQNILDNLLQPLSAIVGTTFGKYYGDDVRGYVGCDAATKIDGRNTTTDTATVTGGTLWDETEFLTLTLNHNNFLTFTAAMATNQEMVFLYDKQSLFYNTNPPLYRFRITQYVSATVVKGFVDRTLPAALQGTGTSKWSYARKVLSGLDYLNGRNVSILGDGNVVGSPNNSNYKTVYSVSGGALTLDQPYAVIIVGLPFITDIETLDIDTPGPIENEGGRMKVVGEVTLYMVNSRPVWVGGASPDLDPANTTSDKLYRLTEQKIRRLEGYDSPIALMTGKYTQTIQPEWDSNGHVFIRNVDPTPLIVSAISPEGLYPMGRG